MKEIDKKFDKEELEEKKENVRKKLGFDLYEHFDLEKYHKKIRENSTQIRNLPKYVYHYTSIETLELILKNKTLRFNSLLNVNDKDEVETRDLPFWGKYCLVCCVTDLKDESLWHWKMYTNMKGVRIRLPVFPFEEEFDVNKHLFEFGKLSLYHPSIPVYPELIKINYTDDESSLYQRVLVTGSYDEAVVLMNALGRYKKKYWAKEQELRYRLLLEPIFDKSSNEVIAEMKVSKDIASCEIGWRAFGHLHTFENINYVDFRLKNECIDNISILLGPKTTDKDSEIVRELVLKYCKNAEVSNSTLNSKQLNKFNLDAL